MTEDKLPFVHQATVDYLEKVYNVSDCLTKTRTMSEGQSLGFIRGAQDVIDTLKAIVARQDAEFYRKGDV